MNQFNRKKLIRILNDDYNKSEFKDFPVNGIEDAYCEIIDTFETDNLKDYIEEKYAICRKHGVQTMQQYIIIVMEASIENLKNELSREVLKENYTLKPIIDRVLSEF